MSNAIPTWESGMGGPGGSAGQREDWEVQRTRASFQGLLCSPVTPLPVRAPVHARWAARLSLLAVAAFPVASTAV